MSRKMRAPETDYATPLCVDLDGTLILTDLLYESVFGLLKINIFYIFLLPLWLIKGKANLKHQIATRTDLDIALLPYNKDFLDFLKQQKSGGRTLTLATASNTKYAQKINLHLNLFDTVLASDAETNMSGERKQKRLVEIYGEKGFDYAGNANIDFDIWAHSREAIIVNPEPGVKNKAKKHLKVGRTFDSTDRGIISYLKAIRLHQWAKNILIFVPLVMSHQLLNPQLALQATFAFLAFGLCASSVYLLNDILDLPSDRQHDKKCKRPFASGMLPIKHGVLLIPILLLAAFSISLYLPIGYIIALALYYIVTLAYSLKLKQVALIDVLVLAGLYTMRIIGGAAAINIVPSFWLLAFSMFIFYSLALVKRYSELLHIKSSAHGKISGRGYRATDIEGLAQSGIASGFIAILVLALYINSAETATLYKHPEALWLLCPLMLYWINRIWLLTRRDEMHDDPVVFAIFDRRSHWIAVAGIAILLVAI